MTPSDPNAIALRDKALSFIRTAVPVAWGYLLTFLAVRLPFLHEVASSPYVFAAVDAAVTLAWYAVWRAIEHRIPAWLTRFLLGANARPTYQNS